MTALNVLTVEGAIVLLVLAIVLVLVVGAVRR